MSFRCSSTIDKVADGLTELKTLLPREASQIQNLVVKLDRVSNTLDRGRSAKPRKSSKVAAVEYDLETSGLEFSVAPTMKRGGAAVFYVSKGQADPKRESHVLRTLANKHGVTFDEGRGQKQYKISVSDDV